MNRRKYNNRFRNSNSKIKEILFSHIENNLKEYIIFTIIFLIGFVIGVIFINNVSENQGLEINNYITSFITSLKENKEINDFALLKNSIKKNVVLAVILWFMGSTVIGISIVYLVVAFRGFCLGYTISSIIATCGLWKGLLFILSTIFLQNIIFIPCIIALSVSGMRLHNSIMKDRRMENIKLEILRHTIFCVFILFLMIISSFIEVFVSKNILIYLIKYLWDKLQKSIYFFALIWYKYIHNKYS